jgi:hypothetical protein
VDTVHVSVDGVHRDLLAAAIRDIASRHGVRTSATVYR